jgi:hypothetical protein
MSTILCGIGSRRTLDRSSNSSRFKPKLSNVKQYRKLSETDTEVYFEKPPATLEADFKADCKECGAGSVLLYDKHERDPAFEYISWTI